MLLDRPPNTNPSGWTDAQTKSAPIYPPCYFSHWFIPLGFAQVGKEVTAIVTEVIKHPAEQIVWEENPSWSFAH